MLRNLGALLAAGLWGCQPGSGPTWTSIKETIRTEFPSVRHIPAEELNHRLHASDEPVPILLDVRQPEEYAVSHLPGAVNVTPGSGLSPYLDGLDRDAPIVAYCSVGYRSSQLVTRLEEAGFTNVVNLEGSIFEWANQGYPLERAGETVEEVHPYDETWGRLLQEDLHAYEPSGR